MRLLLPGQRRRVHIPLPAATVAEAITFAQRRPGDGGRFRLSVRADGVVRARMARWNTRLVPPYFRGRVYEGRTGVVLEGVIRESRTRGFVSALYSIVAVFMAVTAVFCALVRPVMLPGLVICGVSALAFSALGVVLRAGRATGFVTGTAELLARLRERFGVMPDPVVRS